MKGRRAATGGAARRVVKASSHGPVRAGVVDAPPKLPGDSQGTPTASQPPVQPV